MLTRPTIVLALLAATATLAHADVAKKDPKTGKDCVTFMSSELTDNGQLRMNFRNTCASPFEIQIQADKVRQKNIEAGSAAAPSKAYVTCRSDDGCEAAKWQFQ